MLFIGTLAESPDVGICSVVGGEDVRQQLGANPQPRRIAALAVGDIIARQV
jgi:hypothetical protein